MKEVGATRKHRRLTVATWSLQLSFCRLATGWPASKHFKVRRNRWEGNELSLSLSLSLPLPPSHPISKSPRLTRTPTPTLTLTHSQAVTSCQEAIPASVEGGSGEWSAGPLTADLLTADCWVLLSVTWMAKIGRGCAPDPAL